MDQNLEARLRNLAANGQLVHFSVYAKDKRFMASYSPAKGFGNGYGDDTDPVIALCKAIDDWKPARKPREPRRLTEAELPDPCV